MFPISHDTFKVKVDLYRRAAMTAYLNSIEMYVQTGNYVNELIND